MKGFSNESKDLVKYAILLSMSLPHSPDILIPKRFSSSSSSSSSIVEESEALPSSTEIFPDQTDLG